MRYSTGVHASFVHDLAIVLGVGAVTLVIFRRLRQPAVLGYLLAGLIVGPYLPIPLFADPGRVHALSEFGVVLVMFAIGLEFRIGRLIRVLPVSGTTGLIQMGALMWLGFVVGRGLGWNTAQALFLGGSIAISSTMVVSAVFSERPVPADVRELALGVLVLQDVAAIALIATMTVVAEGGALSATELAALLGRLALVLVGLVACGLFVVPRAVRVLIRLESTEALVVGATGLCFAMGVLAEQLGYSVALGAFIAGILVAESGHGDRVEHAIAPLKDVFSAVFFVAVGMTVDPLLALDNAGPAAIVAATVIAGQLVSVTLGGLLSGNGLRRSLGAGLSLGQIGEFAFIISGIGISAGVAPRALAPILVTVAILTAFTTPLAIGLAPRLVHAIDHVLPARLQSALLVYESWIERLRTANRVESGPRRRATRAVILDGLGLLLLAVAWRAERHAVVRLLADWISLPPSPAAPIVNLLALALAAPILFSLLHNTDTLARLALQDILPAPDQKGTFMVDPGTAEALLLGAFRAMVLLSLGMPAAALLRPLLGGPYVATVVGLLLCVIAVRAWRTARKLDRHVRSAAEAMLDVVASQRAGTASSDAKALAASAPSVPGAAHANPTANADGDMLPAQGNLKRYRLQSGMPAVGQTLASMDLRARTGASVLAIHRPGAPVLVPTGSEALQADDLLILAGCGDSLAAAGSLLVGMPSGAEESVPSAPLPATTNDRPTTTGS